MDKTNHAENLFILQRRGFEQSYPPVWVLSKEQLFDFFATEQKEQVEKAVTNMQRTGDHQFIRTESDEYFLSRNILPFYLRV